MEAQEAELPKVSAAGPSGPARRKESTSESGSWASGSGRDGRARIPTRPRWPGLEPRRVPGPVASGPEGLERQTDR